MSAHDAIRSRDRNHRAAESEADVAILRRHPAIPLGFVEIGEQPGNPGFAAGLFLISFRRTEDARNNPQYPPGTPFR